MAPTSERLITTEALYQVALDAVASLKIQDKYLGYDDAELFLTYALQDYLDTTGAGLDREDRNLPRENATLIDPRAALEHVQSYISTHPDLFPDDETRSPSIAKILSETGFVEGVAVIAVKTVQDEEHKQALEASIVKAYTGKDGEETKLGAYDQKLLRDAVEGYLYYTAADEQNAESFSHYIEARFKYAPNTIPPSLTNPEMGAYSDEQIAKLFSLKEQLYWAAFKAYEDVDQKGESFDSHDRAVMADWDGIPYYLEGGIENYLSQTGLDDADIKGLAEYIVGRFQYDPYLMPDSKHSPLIAKELEKHDFAGRLAERAGPELEKEMKVFLSSGTAPASTPPVDNEFVNRLVAGSKPAFDGTDDVTVTEHPISGPAPAAIMKR